MSPFFLYFFFLPFSVFFLYPELFLELDNPIVMASLRCSAAEESQGTLNSFTSPSGRLRNGQVSEFTEMSHFREPQKAGECSLRLWKGHVCWCRAMHSDAVHAKDSSSVQWPKSWGLSWQYGNNFTANENGSWSHETRRASTLIDTCARSLV